MKRLLLKSLCFVLLLPIQQVVWANDWQDRIRVSGFITFGGAVSDADPYPGGDDPEDPEDQVNSEVETPKFSAGSGRYIINDTLDFNAYSKAGVQFDFAVDDKTSATLQLVASGAEDNFDPQLSWAYLSHNLSPDFIVRAGRFRVPLYLASDYLDIGMAYPWVAPPVEVYTTINMDNLNGIDALYTKRAGAWLWKLQPFLGSSNFKRGDFTSEFRNTVGLNTSLHRGNFQLRLSYMEYEFTIRPWPLNAAHQQLRQAIIDAGFQDAVDYGDPNGKITTFTSVGFKWEPRELLLMAEWVSRVNADGGPDVEGYYATIGRRCNRWMPHLTVAAREYKDGDEQYYSGFDELEQQQPALAAATVSLTNAIVGTEDNESESVTLGINYELSDAIITKMSISRYKNKESTGFFEYATADDTNHIIGFTIDALF